MEERKPSHSTDETAKSSNPENAVSEQSNETENAIYPDWTPFHIFSLGEKYAPGFSHYQNVT
jgi:hypothetical protein